MITYMCLIRVEFSSSVGQFWCGEYNKTSLSKQDIWRRHHCFFCEMRSEKRAQKFHTDDASVPRYG